MNILILEPRGFIGKNFLENLYLVREGKTRARKAMEIGEIFECDAAQAEKYCGRADFIIDASPMEAAPVSAAEIIKYLCSQNKACPLIRLYRESDANMFEAPSLQYGKETGAPVFLYRLPEVFGKWDCSARADNVSALCAAAALEAEKPEFDRNKVRELLYVDDLVETLMDVLEGKVQPDIETGLCALPVTYRVSMDEVERELAAFSAQQAEQKMPDIPAGSFAYKLFSTCLSYIPEDRLSYPLKLRVTDGGKQYRVMITEKTGQLTINKYAPGSTLGLHWHNTKWEHYTVISGRGLVRECKVGSAEITEFEVSGENISTVQMIPGFVHSITNISETEDLVMLIWASETFDPKHPDMNDAKI